ncbi:MAG: Putrescine importer PuuP, partial [Neobacillus sp.]|nr:Putrescine importer PuuP [Neobacillus sp.]
IAPVPVYGVIVGVSSGHAALSYFIAMFAMAFSAWTYGQMGAEFPYAGSSYTFVSKGLGSYLGFLAGWAIIVDYLLMPALNYIVLGLYLNALFPAIPAIYIVWVAIVVTCIINLIGIKSLANINGILTIFGFLVGTYFIYACIVVMGQNVGTGFSSLAFYNPSTFSWGGLLTGASIAAFSYIGFDVITTLAEETKEPRKTLPRAILLVCYIMGIFFTAFAFVAQAVHPSTEFVSTGVEILDVALIAGGTTVKNAICIAMVAGALAYSMDMLAAVSRLLFGMGRDGVLPKKIFGYIHPKTYVPVWNTIIVSLLCFALSKMTIDKLIPLINFGGLFAYICVNASCFRYFFMKEKRRKGWGLVKFGIVPVVGFLLMLALWLSLEANAKTIGFIWLALGVLYIIIFTRGFRRPMVELEKVEGE